LCRFFDYFFCLGKVRPEGEALIYGFINAAVLIIARPCALGVSNLMSGMVVGKGAQQEF
jgi:cation transport ATPase